ncbi:MAG TPA: hypothetical protein VK508_01290 [Cyclobacteriaceae bacterium]|nr:hypothetical protein [Cyclobacteriaceae bacterium]
MDLRNFMRRYAEEIGGEYNEYAPEFIIIIVPVSGGRAQTVLGEVRQNDLYNRKLITFSSKVCPATTEMDYRALLAQTSFLNYSRFVILENYLQVQAVSAFENVNESTVKEMVQEVANVADQFELKITGADVQ